MSASYKQRAKVPNSLASLVSPPLEIRIVRLTIAT